MRVDVKSSRCESPPLVVEQSVWVCEMNREAAGRIFSEALPKKGLCKSVDKNLFRETLRRKRKKSDGVQAQGQFRDGRPQSQAQLSSMMHQATRRMENQKAQSLWPCRQ